MMELWPVKFCRNSPSGHFHTLMLSGEAVAKEYLTTTTCNQVSFQKLICLFQNSNSKTVAAELFRGGGGFKVIIFFLLIIQILSKELPESNYNHCKYNLKKTISSIQIAKENEGKNSSKFKKSRTKSKTRGQKRSQKLRR